VGGAEDLRAFEDGSFDAVCMSSVLHWIGDKARALAEARRVLRRSGRIGLTTVPAELSRKGTVGLVLEQLLARAPYAGVVDRSMLTASSARGCTTTELVMLLTETGFELSELQLTQGARSYVSGAAVVDFMEASAFGTFLAFVPDEVRPSLRADLVAAFDALRKAEGVTLRGWSVLVVATALTN
jgi:hypothetical protein